VSSIPRDAGPIDNVGDKDQRVASVRVSTGCAVDRSTPKASGEARGREGRERVDEKIRTEDCVRLFLNTHTGI